MRLSPERLAEIDPGVRFAVRVLDAAGVETYQSCQGGAGHCTPEPMVEFYGNPHEGHLAYTAVMNYGLPVKQLNRYWCVSDGELSGPNWQLTFFRTMEDRADEQPIFMTETRPNV